MADMSDSRLTKSSFIWDYGQTKNCWCSQVKTIFDPCNLGQLFGQKVKCCNDETMNSILQKHKIDWSEKIKNKPKLRTYRFYKCDFSAGKISVLESSKMETINFGSI